jgi:hypothetical protein
MPHIKVSKIVIKRPNERGPIAAFAFTRLKITMPSQEVKMFIVRHTR